MKRTLFTLALFVAGALSTGCQISLFDDLSLDSFENTNPIIDSSLEQNKENYHALFFRGREYLNNNNAAEALKFFDRAAKLNPDFEEAQIGAGLALIHQKRFSTAEERFRKILEVSRDSPEALEGLSVALYENKKFEEAREVAEKAVALDESLYRAQTVLGQYHYGQLNYAKAEEHWRLALLHGAPAKNLEPLYQDVRLYVEKYSAQ